ncbi:MAG: hypothetical protein WA906_07200 [Pacificimonas sp.]
MWKTAELRWWWQGAPDPALAAWLLRGVTPVEDFRTDLYLADTGQADMGIKRRGRERVEVKTLCGLPDIALPSNMEGQAELWVKVGTDALTLDDERTLAVGKSRRQRHLGYDDGTWKELGNVDEAAQGISAEIATIDAAEAKWGTVCLEAWGTDDDGLARLLQSAITLLGAWPDAVPSPDIVGGYPLWLNERTRAATASSEDD